jgi:hypothetical protein
MMNLFKKKENSAPENIRLDASENLTLNEEYAQLVMRYTESLKDKFTSKDIINKLRIKDKELQHILSRWIAELVEKSELNLILTGTNSNGDYVFLRGDLFDRLIKSQLNVMSYLSNENQTYQFLQEISGSREVNLSILKSEIERKLSPLVRFDDGSRNMPIMLNLCRFLVPETNVIMSDEILNIFGISQNIDDTESKKVKKMMFTNSAKELKKEEAENIITTAFSLLLQEAGKLILTKEEIEKTRAYKVFFSSIDFEALQKLMQEVYKFSPITGSEFISFYPENWLDLKIIRQQIEKEGEQSPAMSFDILVRENYSFLSEGEIEALKKIIKAEHEADDTKILKNKKAPKKPPQDEETQIIADSPIPEKTEEEENETIDSITASKNEIEMNKKSGTDKFTDQKSNLRIEKERKKKKIEPSEPLKFLDSMIVNENNKDQQKQTRSTEKPKMPHDSLHELRIIDIKTLNKKEIHYLIRILDSTIVDSGYYSHHSADEAFSHFLTKIEKTDLFIINTEGENSIITRNPVCSHKEYSRLREDIDAALLTEVDEKLLNKKENGVKNEETAIKTTEAHSVSDKAEVAKTGDKAAETTHSLDTLTMNQESSHELSEMLKVDSEQKDAHIADTVSDGDYDNLKDSLLAGLIVEDSDIQEEENFASNENTNIDATDKDRNFVINETLSPTLENKDSPEEDIEHREIFEIIKNNFSSDSDMPSERNDLDSHSTEVNRLTNLPGNEERREDTLQDTLGDPKSDDVQDEENLLSGKIISVLTENEENWLKIEMMSKMLGFELRDGLAYKPDIAIFDDSYKHLEPIARNSGAMIMQLEDFMKRIGLPV